MVARSKELADRLAYYFGLADTLPDRKRRLYIGMFVLGIVLLVVDTILTPYFSSDWVSAFANILLAALLTAGTFFLWRRCERQELVLLGVFAGATVYLLLSMFISLRALPPITVRDGLLRSVSPWLIWFIILEMTFFFTFRANTARRFSLVISILFLGFVVLAIAQMPPLPLYALHDFALLLTANVLVILLAYPLAHSQEHSAQTDFLTTLPNRSHGYEALLGEIERARRYSEGFAIILFDIDHFKKINDSCGHSCGDAVLRELASFVDEHIRRTDLICRWGGEEFLLLMTHCDLASARLKAEHLRTQIKNRPFHKNINLTASFGITAYYPYDTANTLLERVDDALYRAKRNGRNCVQVE